MSQVRTRVLKGFNDASFGPDCWRDLLSCGDSDVIFLTWEWQCAWWESLGRGQLLLILAEMDGEDIALAPFFTEAGMVYFVGSGGSDYLDFIGNISDPHILDELLTKARESVTNFIGFVFYHVPERSHTGNRLMKAAERLGLNFFDEGELLAPAMDLNGKDGHGLAATRKKSLVRHENFFRREGSLEVVHLKDGRSILPHLEEFFEQHVARWANTVYPSLFCDMAQRMFYKRLTSLATDTGWLRFTIVNWEGRPIAFHFGFCYGGSYMWYKPSFAIELARRSPGEVLIRQLLLAAIEEGAKTFDFGLGEEGFKSRFATHVNKVNTCSLYPPTRVIGERTDHGNDQ